MEASWERSSGKLTQAVCGYHFTSPADKFISWISTADEL